MRAQLRQHRSLYAITVAISIANAVILLLCLNHYKPHQEIEFYSVAASAIGMEAGSSSQ